jgi:uncharacterized phage infection (PIP) family protein YhgE
MPLLKELQHLEALQSIFAIKYTYIFPYFMNIDYDLKEILTRIESKVDKVENKVDKLSEDVNGIKVELVATRAELKGEIKVLDEKIDGVNKSLNEKIDGVNKSLNEKIDGVNKSLGEKIDGIAKRVDTQEFINRGAIIGLLIALLGGFAKIFGLAG